MKVFLFVQTECWTEFSKYFLFKDVMTVLKFMYLEIIHQVNKNWISLFSFFFFCKNWLFMVGFVNTNGNFWVVKRNFQKLNFPSILILFEPSIIYSYCVIFITVSFIKCFKLRNIFGKCLKNSKMWNCWNIFTKKCLKKFRCWRLKRQLVGKILDISVFNLKAFQMSHYLKA